MPRFAIAPLGLTTEGSTKFKLKGCKCYLKKLQCVGGRGRATRHRRQSKGTKGGGDNTRQTVEGRGTQRTLKTAVNFTFL